MGIVRTYGMVVDGIEAVQVTLEARRASNLRPQDIRVVGLPDAAVKEGMHRARTALWSRVEAVARAMSSGLLVNLSPADLKKSGRSLDLPLAMVYAGVLLGLEGLSRLAFVGEVGLGGEVRPVPGVLAAVVEARKRGRSGVVLPTANGHEARLIDGIALYPVDRVEEALQVVAGEREPDRGPRGAPVRARGGSAAYDLAEVHGQFHARRALEVAAAGRHHLMMEGSPGSGKTMLARRLTSILPPLDEARALEAALIRSVVQVLDPERMYEPPFRAPHHTASTAGMTGGGSPVRPGEVTLAHCGVLFLDELPEFDRRVLEALREPIEDRLVHLTRAGSTRRFPADFQLLAAMNPCPCGWHGLGDGRCTCTPRQVQSYRSRISGPILDRFDMRVYLQPVAPESLLEEGGGEPSSAVAERVARVRDCQRRRYGEPGGAGTLNGDVSDAVVRRAARYGAKERAFLLRLVTVHRLSARAARRLERVARTLADLDEQDRVGEVHLMEALGFRLGGDLEGAPGAAGPAGAGRSA